MADIDPIEIGPLTFPVVFDTDIRSDNDTKLYGEIRFTEQIIRVDSKFEANPQRRELILWHEVLHGILEVAGLDTALKCSEEEFVKTFTYHLVDVLHRNDTAKWGSDEKPE